MLATVMASTIEVLFQLIVCDEHLPVVLTSSLCTLSSVQALPRPVGLR